VKPSYLTEPVVFDCKLPVLKQCEILQKVIKCYVECTCKKGLII